MSVPKADAINSGLGFVRNTLFVFHLRFRTVLSLKNFVMKAIE